nr:Chain B, p21 [Homo sapiens]
GRKRRQKSMTEFYH